MQNLFIVATLSVFFAMSSVQSQDKIMNSIPYQSIGSYPEVYTPATVVARTIDGLGYRYYWATEGLRDDDLIFRPSQDASSVIETLEHLHGLSQAVLNCISGKPNIRTKDKKKIPFEDLRVETLMNLKSASDLLIINPNIDMSTKKIIFKRGEKESEFEFWHLLNGQLADAIYHTGQIVSFRRTNENPVNSKMNVFMGKNRE